MPTYNALGMGVEPRGRDSGISWRSDHRWRLGRVGCRGRHELRVGPGGEGVLGEGRNGVHGTANGGYGGQFEGGRAQLRLVPTGSAGRPTYRHPPEG